VGHEKTSASAWSESVYLDTDVILAELKVDDWLASDVDIDSLAAPKTSVATGIELQYVMEDVWERDRLARAHRAVAETGIQLVQLTEDSMDEAADLRSTYESVNVFDAVHLGTARSLDEPIVSTDTLFPEIAGVAHIDPRDLDR
jgi:predicted nucleic acid-binding protein